MQVHHDEIRKGLRPPPKEYDKPYEIQKAICDYLEWGHNKGGRNGFGWSKTLSSDKERILKHWKSELDLRHVKDLDSSLSRVEVVLRKLSEAGKSPKTVKHYGSHLSAFCKWCVERDFLKEHPLAKLRAKKVCPETPTRDLESEEIDALLKTAPPSRNLLYRVALNTGFRQSELRELKSKSLDPDGPFLRLPAAATKNRRAAAQPISQDLFDELAEVAMGKSEDVPLLGMPKKNTCGENFVKDFGKTGFKRLTRKGKATFHSFRVNYINRVIETGADLKTTMELSRHSAAQLTMETYAKPKEDKLRKAAEAVSRSGISKANSTTEAQPEEASTPNPFVDNGYGQSGKVSSPGPVTNSSIPPSSPFLNN